VARPDPTRLQRPSRSRIVFALVAAEIAVCVALAAAGALIESGARERGGRPAPSPAGPVDLPGLVAHLGLTDLALVSDASYCRHPTQADRFAPFSDHPGALEHFPAGSLVPPPKWVARWSARRPASRPASWAHPDRRGERRAP